MLTTDGKVKVMDFGIARASAVPSITQTAAVVGTAQYIAPEQAQGLEVDARSDVYALGCCLYEMLTGQVPFTGPTPVAIAYRHVREDPTPPRMLNPDVPVSLERVCLKAMAKRPEDRYQTALEMRQDLERVRTGQPVSVGAIAAAALPENPTTVLGGTQTAASGRSIGYGEELPGQRRSSAGWVVAAILALLVVGFAAFLITRTITSPTQTSAPAPSTQAPTTQAPTTTEAPTTSEQATTTSEQATTTTRRSTTTTTERTTTSTTEGSTTTSTSSSLAASTLSSVGPTST
ncbi:MAG TPA: protein kinase, partial [Actinomycetes bacterium]|nr:protein kinase [Actinomycetes bacterium]